MKNIGTLIAGFLTSINLFCGFLSVYFSFEGEFVKAFYFVVLGALFDIADGRVARASGGASKFGTEFDSLADAITFGFSTSAILYNMHFRDFKFGIPLSFLPLLTVAIRLARFNIFQPDKRYFIGLSSPMGALTISSFSFILPTFFMIFVSVIISYLMISNLKFRSFKDFSPKQVPLFIFVSAFLFVFFVFYPFFLISISNSIYIIYCILAENIFSSLKYKYGEGFRFRHNFKRRGTGSGIFYDTGGKDKSSSGAGKTPS